MHFLIDANLPRSTSHLIQIMGYTATDVRNIAFGQAEDVVIAAYAIREGMTILTRDFDFADVRNYPPADYAGIVVVDLPNEMHADVILQVIERFVSRSEWIERLPRKLAILGAGSVRFRAS
jgi:predicted nuclease of predicted toxin-antitoxin system